MIHKKAAEHLKHMSGDFYAVIKQWKENQGVKGKGYKKKPVHKCMCVRAEEKASIIFWKLIKAFVNHKTSVTSSCKQL